MRYLTIGIIFFSLCLCIKNAQALNVKDTLELHSSATIYPLQKVKLPKKLLATQSVDALFKKFQSGKVEQYSAFPKEIVPFGEQPFLNGVYTAFLEHRPIVISPDVIWLLIEQGFARHVVLNAEKYRSRFVQFEGKKELVVEMGTSVQIGNPNSQWNLVFPQFISQIESYVGEELVRTMQADFSTSTATTLIASQITLMEAMKQYFDYRVTFLGCGLPSITIEGSMEDWEKILKRLDYVESFDLQNWVKELRPIIQQFVQAKKGDFDKKFWVNIARVHNGKSSYNKKSKEIDGWITKFYPFDHNEKPRDLSLSIRFSDLIAPEFVKVPFIAEDILNKVEYKMEFWAGIFGMEQDKVKKSLKPYVGWAIVHSTNKK